MLPCFCLVANTNTIAVLFCCRILYFDICHFFSILFATDQENQRYNNGLPLLRQIVVCLYFYLSHILYCTVWVFSIYFFCISQLISFVFHFVILYLAAACRQWFPAGCQNQPYSHHSPFSLAEFLDGNRSLVGFNIHCVSLKTIPDSKTKGQWPRQRWTLRQRHWESTSKEHSYTTYFCNSDIESPAATAAEQSKRFGLIGRDFPLHWKIWYLFQEVTLNIERMIIDWFISCYRIFNRVLCFDLWKQLFPHSFQAFQAELL